MKLALKICIVFLPWKLKRLILIKVFKYKIHSTARIGYSFVYPKFLEMEEKAVIGHLNTIINLDAVIMKKFSSINRSNWITGFPTKTKSKHFIHQTDRESKLIMGRDSSITKKHHIDCTSVVKVGNFTTIAGYATQFLTHSVSIQESIQDSAPIEIGDYCFVGTNCVVLGGATLPSYSVLGSKSLLNKKHDIPYSLYAGVPAKRIKELNQDAKFFSRKSRFVI